MKIPLLLFAAGALVFGAVAGDFEARVRAGELSEKRPDGGRYLSVLGPAYGEAMRTCIAPGTNDPNNLGRFELVADITSNGTVVNAVVRPHTPVSLCFAREFGKSKLLPPPIINGANLHPIYLAMRVTP